MRRPKAARPPSRRPDLPGRVCAPGTCDAPIASCNSTVAHHHDFDLPQTPARILTKPALVVRVARHSRDMDWRRNARFHQTRMEIEPSRRSCPAWLDLDIPPLKAA